MPSLTERLAAHLLRPVAANVQTRARLHLLDWLGCVAAARRSEQAEVARRAEPDVLTRAALLGNVLEMDDVHRGALLHPGPVVWPAALSAAREREASMAALLEGGVRGYEAVIAVGATFDAWHYAHWHNSASAGAFGGAAAAASVFGLDAEAIADALGHAGSLAGGLWRMRHEAGMTKQLHVAQASLTGLWHARLARAGAAGPRAILEGEQGLYAAMTRAPRPMVFGAGWQMMEVSFKPWGACRHVHPAIDAALTLRQQGRLSAPVHVRTYADALAFCDRPEPKSVIDAKFSLQHGVAIVLDKGEPELADFEPGAIARLAPLRAQVTVAEDAAFTDAYPAHFGAAIGDLVLADTLGDPERPLPADQVEAKARALMQWGGVDPGPLVEAALTGMAPSRILELLEATV
ncbi:MmgE/PrpD family protein [Sphingomonas sp.]|jgi:2-methylcitrate dehydratase PrpD|uniref:MmgE/PrpD family protein n=1 Tax=Sphingomonas sp. TaxID=28214 RepID=UPI002DEB788D|nr:MmgE/PrpD family protein [Sphingomonas sp.]HEV2567422.1 MmgE/PrpD family protein [Sphingomonas sp.]